MRQSIYYESGSAVSAQIGPQQARFYVGTRGPKAQPCPPLPPKNVGYSSSKNWIFAVVVAKAKD